MGRWPRRGAVSEGNIRLFAGWGVGFLGSLLGMVAAYQFDMPTGAAVVATFGAMLAVAIAASLFIPSVLPE